LCSRRWWIEHWVDLLSPLATLLLALFIHRLDFRDRQQDRESQELARLQSVSENDIHQAFVLLAAFESQRGSTSAIERRGIAEIIEEYESDGRLYEPATHIFLRPLRTECDDATFQILVGAIRRASNVRRPNATTNADREGDTEARARTGTELLDAIHERNQACTTPSHPQRITPMAADKTLDISLGSFNVSCNEHRSDHVDVLLGTVVPSGYALSAPAKATFNDTSNVRAASASADRSGDTVVVSYSLDGLGPEFFAGQVANCPGGGHGALVLHLELRLLPGLKHF
jgi:hypothetical protein